MSDLPPKETHEAIYALGYFVVSWSVLEATLEVAVAKQLDLGPRDGSLITAGMQFKPKAVMLKSLLMRDQTTNAAAIDALNKIMNRSERNDAVHSVIGWNDVGLIFTRRKNDGGVFTSKEKPFTRDEMHKVSCEILDLSANLKKALGISEDHYLNWLQEAHKAANNA